MLDCQRPSQIYNGRRMRSNLTIRLQLACIMAGALTVAAAAQRYEFGPSGWTEAAQPVKGSPAGELEMARRAFDAAKYRDVVSIAKRFQKLYKTAPQREEVYSLAGRAEMKKDLYYQAYEWFEKQLKAFPSGPMFQQSLHHEYDIAQEFLAGKKRHWGPFRLDARDEAGDILLGIATYDPGSQLAKEALVRLGRDRYDHREYAKAADAYDQFLKLYPRDKQTPEIMLDAAKSFYASYRGPEYDDTPLIEAGARFANLIERYPNTPQAESATAYFQRTKDRQAVQMRTVGQFYQRVSKPASAAYCYQRTIDQYPDTPGAQQAAGDLARLAPQAAPPPPPQDNVPQAAPAGEPAPHQATHAEG